MVEVWVEEPDFKSEAFEEHFDDFLTEHRASTTQILTSFVQERRASRHHARSSVSSKKKAKLEGDDLLKVACTLSLREGVRLSFVCKSWWRLARQRIAFQLHISSQDLVPRGPEQSRLLPEALVHLNHCWGGRLLLLDLSGCDFLTDLTLQALMSAFWENLLQLKLAGCGRLTDGCIKSATAACRKLKEIDLSGCGLMTDCSMRYLVDSCPLIEQIRLAECMSMPDGGLAIIGRHVPQLRVLDIRDCPLVTDDGLTLIAFGCPQLQTLDLEGCQRVTDHGLQILSENLTGLLELSLSEMSDKVTEWGIRPLIEASKNLTTLRLRKVANDMCLASVACQCRQLQEIDISDSQAVSDLGLELLSGCQWLLVFRAENCLALTGAGVQTLAWGCQYLQLVDMSGCTALCDAGLSGLGSKCRQLQQLDLCRCTRISDAGICSLANCTLLHGLVLSHCISVTDIGVEALAAGCPELEELNLFQTDISNASLFALAEKCPKIHTLNIAGCFNVSQKGTSAVSHMVPHMRQLIERGVQLSLEHTRQEEEAAAAALAAEEAEQARLEAEEAALQAQALAEELLKKKQAEQD